VIRSNERSISTRGPARRGKGALLAAVAGLIVMAPSLVLAQINPAPVGGMESRGNTDNVATREGNTYDHRDHQPTQAEINAAQQAAGKLPPPSPSTAEVEKEVHDLLKQADTLDKQSDELDLGQTPTR